MFVERTVKMEYEMALKDFLGPSDEAWLWNRDTRTPFHELKEMAFRFTFGACYGLNRDS